MGQFVKFVEFMCVSNAVSVRYDSMTSLMQQAFTLRFQKRISHHQITIALNLWALCYIFLKTSEMPVVESRMQTGTVWARVA